MRKEEGYKNNYLNIHGRCLKLLMPLVIWWQMLCRAVRVECLCLNP